MSEAQSCLDVPEYEFYHETRKRSVNQRAWQSEFFLRIKRECLPSNKDTGLTYQACNRWVSKVWGNIDQYPPQGVNESSLRLSTLPTEIKVESGTSRSKSGTSANSSDSGKPWLQVRSWSISVDPSYLNCEFGSQSEYPRRLQEAFCARHALCHKSNNRVRFSQPQRTGR